MKTNWKKAFFVAYFICLALQLSNVIISISLAMPAQVVLGGSVTSPEDATPAIVAKEFVSKGGTALAPPIHIMIVYGLLFLAARRKGKWGMAGTFLISGIGVIFTLATFGEYVNPDRFPLMSGEIYTALLVMFQASAVGVTVLGVVSLITSLVTKRKSTIEM